MRRMLAFNMKALRHYEGRTWLTQVTAFHCHSLQAAIYSNIIRYKARNKNSPVYIKRLIPARPAICITSSPADFMIDVYAIA